MPAALVTGATSPLGDVVVSTLRAAGYDVLGTSLEEHPRRQHVVADLSDPDAARAVVTEAVTRFGTLDAVICLAGAMPIGRLEDATLADFDLALRASLLTFATTTQAALPVLAPGASIVVVTSVNARLAAPGVAAYAAAKGAVEALVRQLALDQARRGVRVNAVAPGLIDNGQVSDAGAGYPRGSAVTAKEVADAILFLASPASSGITGSALPVDAGLSITSPSTFLRDDLRERLDPRS